MDPPFELQEVLAEGRTASLVEDSIYSALRDTSLQHPYDRRATVYDLIVATRLYNQILWGSSPLDYAAFAQRAITSSATGSVLDAGCGSLLFSARAYIKADRTVIVCDQSLAMLRRARRRLRNLSEQPPRRIVLLQADLSDLPFRIASFQTIVCLNVLHLFEDAAGLTRNLKTLLSNEGHFYLTSLVKNNRLVGDHYLNALHAMGEFVRPRSLQALREMLDCTLGEALNYRVKGNMAFVSTD